MDQRCGFFLEPRVVRNALARLDRERERLGHLCCPIAQHVLLRQPVERVVDLDRRKFAGVKAQHPVVLQLLRVERSLPLLERVAARSSEQLHDAMRFFEPSAFFGFSRARLAFSASISATLVLSPPGASSPVLSWSSILRRIVSSTRSRTVSRYLAGSNTSFDVWSISCLASLSSASFTSPSGTVTSVVGRISSA